MPFYCLRRFFQAFAAHWLHGLLLADNFLMQPGKFEFSILCSPVLWLVPLLFSLFLSSRGRGPARLDEIFQGVGRQAL